MAAWQTVMTYESKLVRRHWLFYLFVVGTFCYALAFLVPWDIQREKWWGVALASSLPVRAVYFLNLFQSLIVIFLACDISRQRKKAESREVLSVKPLSNSQFFGAELAGLSLPFLIADVIFMALCLFINSIIPDSPVNLWVYLSFLLRGLLPTFIFVAGLSLFINRILRHPFPSWLVLAIFFFVSYAYLTMPLYGILDFRASLLPESFSSIVGFAHANVCLLQRGMFLLLGVGLLCVAVPHAKRLPNMPGRKVFYHATGCLLLILAMGTGYLYIDKFQTRRENRDAYRKIFARYEAYPKARISTHEIMYTPEGDTFSATSRMTAVNRKTRAMDQLILFLNPSVKINRLTSEKRDIPFQRDHQVVVIEHPLAPGDSVTLEIEYGGHIDEDIYQVNIDDEKFFAPVRQLTGVEQYGKHSAFMSQDYTLLIPEVLWYPSAVAPVALQPLKETDFTNYTLHVKNPDKQVVLSQGIPKEGQTEVTYRNLQPLTGLSLCMGDYVKRSVVVDSITLEYYTYPGNDFYLQPFNGWLDEIAKKPDAQEYWEELVSNCRNRIEGSMPNPYPFKQLKIVEVPSSFLNDYSFHNNVQPEIIFFGERILQDHENPSDLSSYDLEEISVQENLLLEKFPRFLEETYVEGLFSNFHWSVTSDKFAGIDMLFAKIANPFLDKRSLLPSDLNNISEQGLEGLIRERYSGEYPKAIDMKIYQLLGYLTTITTWDLLKNYIREFYESARFREVNFDLFMEGFRERFGQDISSFMNDWYSTRKIPRLAIKDLSYRKAKETQAIDFKVANIGNANGTVSLIRTYSDDYGRWVILNWRSFLVKPGEYKRIVAHDINRGTLFFSTNFSRCIPERKSFDNISLQEGDLPAECIFPLEKNQFYPPGEIIVDNEDEGFHLIDSSGNRFKRWAERLAEEDTEGYNYGIDFKKDTWGRPFILDNVYGEEIHSAFVKVAGSGNCKAEWKTKLPEAGTYEIFAYRAKSGGIDLEYTYESNCPGMKNYYTIYTPEGCEEIVWEVTQEEADWISLGTFDLPAGESRIILDDRGVPPIEEKAEPGMPLMGSGKTAQLVVADAVKWVKVK